MKILITGCCGFIGSNLSRALSKDNEIIGIDNLSYGSIENIEGINMTFIQGDLCNISLLQNVKVDVIIHLASQKIPRYDNAFRTLEENITINRIVVDKCIKDGSKLVFASTSEVYGKNTNYPLKETHDVIFGNPLVPKWAYGLSKYWAEQYILAAHEQFGLEYIICRFFSVYGKHQAKGWWGGVQSAFIENIKNDTPVVIYGKGDQQRIFTHIDDVTSAIKLLLSTKSTGIYNVSGDQKDEISIQVLALLLYKMLGKPVNIDYKHYPDNYEDTQRKIADTSKLRALGWTPEVSLKEGLSKLLKT